MRAASARASFYLLIASDPQRTAAEREATSAYLESSVRRLPSPRTRLIKCQLFCPRDGVSVVVVVAVGA